MPHQRTRTSGQGRGAVPLPDFPPEAVGTRHSSRGEGSGDQNGETLRYYAWTTEYVQGLPSTRPRRAPLRQFRDLKTGDLIIIV
jgi:hypothetical protein